MKTLLILLLFLPSLASAWGRTGHNVICEIAFQELAPQARNEVKRLIRLDKEFTTFAESCRWADEPRERAPDHYINVPRNLSIITTDACPMAETCLFPAIENDLQIISDKSQSDTSRLAALKFLGHWVGDIHQPLHVSFQDDRGANSIDVVGMCQGALHGVWDGCIIARQMGDNEKAMASEFLSSITEADRQVWRSSTVTEWANESYQFTLSPQTGYCTMKDDGCWYWPHTKTLGAGNLYREMIITQEYLSTNQSVIELRLKQAGVRLGAMLNTALQ